MTLIDGTRFARSHATGSWRGSSQRRNAAVCEVAPGGLLRWWVTDRHGAVALMIDNAEETERGVALVAQLVGFERRDVGDVVQRERGACPAAQEYPFTAGADDDVAMDVAL